VKQLLIFSAEWCAGCKMLKRVLADTNLPVDRIRAVDVDLSPSATKEFSIGSLPTLILFEDGVETKRAIGNMTKKQLLDFCNASE